MALPSFWLDSDNLEPLSDETLASLEKNKTYTSTTGTGIKKGVAKGNLLLVCVRVAPRSTQNKVIPQLLKRFPPLRPKCQFPAIKFRNSLERTDDGEADNTPEWNLRHRQIKTHL